MRFRSTESEPGQHLALEVVLIPVGRRRRISSFGAGENTGGEKVRSVREAEQPGDGEILVQVWPVDPEPAADQLHRQTSIGGLMIE